MMEMCLHTLYTFRHLDTVCDHATLLYHHSQKWQSLLLHWSNPLILVNLVNQTFLHRVILLLSSALDGSLRSQDLFIKLSMSCTSYSMLHLIAHSHQLIHCQLISSQLLSFHLTYNLVLMRQQNYTKKITQLSHRCMQWKSRSPLYDLRFLNGRTSVYLLNKYTTDSLIIVRIISDFGWLSF